MKKLLSLLLISTSVFAFSQVDTKAKAILDKVSAQTKDYKTVVVEFSLNITSPEGNPINQKGKAYLKGDKYYLSLPDQEVFCDGNNVWTYIKDENECYLTAVDESDKNAIKPSELLTVWEKGFDYKYSQETTFQGKAVHEIFLYPKNKKESKFHTVIVRIDKEKNEVVFVHIKGKDGVHMKYNLLKLDPNTPINDTQFTFNKAKYPGVKIIEE